MKTPYLLSIALIQQQGRQGVPDGGHISAQLAQIWAMAKELKGLFTEGRQDTCHAWRDAMSVDPIRVDMNLDQPFDTKSAAPEPWPSSKSREAPLLPVDL